MTGMWYHAENRILLGDTNVLFPAGKIPENF